jgi:hypothetical protein
MTIILHIFILVRLVSVSDTRLPSINCLQRSPYDTVSTIALQSIRPVSALPLTILFGSKMDSPLVKITRNKKAEQAPKRFKSAYMFFSVDKHKELRAQLTNTKVRSFPVAADAWLLYATDGDGWCNDDDNRGDHEEDSRTVRVEMAAATVVVVPALVILIVAITLIACVLISVASFARGDTSL